MTTFDFLAVYQRARDEGNAQILVDALPYAQFLGMRAVELDGELCFHLPPRDTNVGNPVLPAVHGGALGGFMEMAAVVTLLMQMDHTKLAGPLRVPKLVDFSVDYLRAARLVDTFAACEVVRQGRRMANVVVKIWQESRAAPTATARSHYLLAVEG